MPVEGTGQPSASFQQVVVEISAVSASFEQKTVSTGQASALFNQITRLAFGQLSVNFSQKTVDSGVPYVSFTQSGYDDTTFISPGSGLQSGGSGTSTYGISRTFSLSVVISGSEWESVIDAVVVTAEEGTARTAVVKLSPPSGSIDPISWIGANVSVYYVSNSQSWKIFGGIVDDPVWEPEDGILTLNCSDNLQLAVESMENTAIASLVGGFWHESIFDKDSVGWDYAQERMSTVAASLDMDVNGLLRSTDWSAKSTPDFTFNNNSVIYKSVSVKFPQRSKITNKSVLDITYRFQRQYQRDVLDGWRYDRSFCDYFTSSTTLPEKDMIQSALEGTGWLIQWINFEPLWGSAYQLGHWGWGPQDGPRCGFEYIWVNDAPNTVIGASWKISKRWTQSVDEKYRIEVIAPESIDGIGEVITRNSASYETEFEGSAWEEKQNGLGYLATATDSEAKSSTSVGVSGDYGVLDGDEDIETNIWGDSQKNLDSDDDRENTILTAIAVERVKILNAHRDTDVSFDTPLFPLVDLKHTIRIDTPEVLAKGKVGAFTHTIDILRGQAITNITLVISRKHGTASVNDWDQLSVPSAPQTLPEPTENTGSTGLAVDSDTQLGGKLTSPDYDEDRAGYSGNYLYVSLYSIVRQSDLDDDYGKVIANWAPPTEATEIEPGSVKFPERFLVKTPEIEQELVDNAEGTKSHTIEVSIPDDEFTLTAP